MKKTERVAEYVPSLREVRIRNFRAIEDLTIDWSDLMTFFGANGSGKSTILSAIGLALGDEETLWQLRDLDPESTVVSLVIQSDHREFREVALDAGKLPFTGVARFRSWDTTWKNSDLPEQLVLLLRESYERPLVRYDLARIEGLQLLCARSVDMEGDCWDDYPDAELFEFPVKRSFDRTLLAPADWSQRLRSIDPEDLKAHDLSLIHI